ncbi:virion core protein [Orf virus]|uniref:Virion core protein n=1 Tax=Orf virus (strain NZ2) TaxID=10259 RepID=Q2F895_ORFN2|nr:virion core protein [Orf virus]
MDLRRRFASDLAKSKLVLSETSSSLFTKCPQTVVPAPEQPCPPDEEVDSVDKYTVKEAGRYYQSRLKSATACMQRPTTGQSPLAPSLLPRGAKVQSTPLNVMPAACSTPVAACSATAVVCPAAAPACPPAPACPAPAPACPAPAATCPAPAAPCPAPAPAPACPAPAATCPAPAPAPACPPATAPTCPPPAACPAPACPPSTRQCPPAPPLPTKPAPAAKPIFLQQSLPPPQYPASSCPTIKAPAASPVLESRVPDKVINADNDKDFIKKELADIADSVRDLNAESLSLTRDIETAKSVTQSAINDLRRLLTGSVATLESPSTLRDRVDNTGTS